MKIRLTIACIALGSLLAAVPVLSASETGPEALISRTRALILTPDRSHDVFTKALTDVLAASLLILPKTDYAEEYRSRIGTVQKMFEDNVLFSDKIRQYLGLAYKLVTGGVAWQLPPELKAPDRVNKGIELATEICVKLLDAALAELEAGRNEEAVRDLVGFVLLVVTPIEA